MHGKAELLAVRIMVKAGRKSAFIRVSGLFVAYGNDKRLFYPQKNNTADISWYTTLVVVHSMYP